jgi:hypothetical protein
MNFFNKNLKALIFTTLVALFFLTNIFSVQAQTENNNVDLQVLQRLIQTLLDQLQLLQAQILQQPTTVTTTTTGSATATAQPTPPPIPINSYISVYSPYWHQLLIRGSVMNIAWHNSKNVSDRVFIELRKGDNPYAIIKSNVPNIGFYNWTIPSTFPTGTDYKIRITDQSNRNIYGESGSFSIFDKSSMPSIRVISPNGGETLREGDMYKIQWEALNVPSSEKAPARVYIEIRRNDGALLSLGSFPYNQREYLWKVTTKGFGYGRACLAKGTKVLMSDGSYKNIEEIKQGDYVVSYDLQKKQFTISKVIQLLQRYDPIIAINKKLRASPDQLIYTTEGFKQAQDIKVNDLLLTQEGKTEKVISAEKESATLVETFDLILEGNQNFFADGYLVHSVSGIQDINQNKDSSFLNKIFNFFKEITGINIAKAQKIDNYSYKVYIGLDWGAGYVSDESDNWFYITPVKTIKIFYPKGQEIFTPGSKINIQWESTDDISRVTIQLYKGNNIHSVLASNIPNRKYFIWTIPMNFPVGTDYKIRISDSSNSKIFSEHEYPFGIVSSANVVSEEVKCIFKELFSGDSAGCSPAPENSILYSGNKNLYCNTEKGQNSCTVYVKGIKGDKIAWNGACRFGLGESYKYTIVDGQNESIIFDCSPIYVYKPEQNSKYNRGSNLYIAWDSGKYAVDRVFIELRKGDNPYAIIKSNVPNTANTGSYNWTIPSTFPTGTDYKIRITDQSNRNIYGESGYFRIQ